MTQKKKVIYIDMDGVLADFTSGVEHVTQTVIEQCKGELKHIDGYYSYLKPMCNACEAVEKLMKHFDVYVLSTAPWDNPGAWSDKRIWLEKHFPLLKYRLILSHHKQLLTGDFIIDDRTVHGVSDFVGEHIHFGTDRFPHWCSVLEYFNLVPSTQ